jgi:hypothetical protein
MKSYNHFVIIDNDPSSTSRHTVAILLDQSDDVNDSDYFYIVKPAQANKASYQGRYKLVPYYLKSLKDKQQVAHENSGKMQHLHLTSCIRVASGFQ